jgi:signal transduction histidine kinase
MNKPLKRTIKSGKGSLQKTILEKENELRTAKRHLEIEAALERVRSLTMVMKRSVELSEIILTVYKELKQLDIALTRTLIWLFSENPNTFEVWLADSEAENTPFVMQQEVEHPYHKRMFQAWKKRKSKWVYINEGEGKKDLDDYLFNQTAAAAAPEEVKAGIRAVDKIVNSFSFHNFGGLQADGAEELSDDNFEILYRFAKEFDLAYTRFLDLKKAEEQAREAHIEMALERVRSKAMAMHNSKDISEAAAVVFKELKGLNIDILRCGMTIFEKTGTLEVWTSTSSKKGEVVQLTGKFIPTAHPLLQVTFDGWKNKDTWLSYKLIGENLKSYYKLLQKTPDYNLPDAISLPSRQYANMFYFKEGGIFTFTNEPISEENNKIFYRFTKVFSLTFRRYLDLKIAENQAREAHVEAALERVRARTMAMHKSEELLEVIITVFDQLNKLSIESDGAHIHIYDDTKDFNLWIANPEQNYASRLYFPYFNHRVFNDFWKSLERGEKFKTEVFSRKEKDLLFKHFFKHSDLKDAPENRKQYLLNSKGWARSIVFGKNAALTMNNFNGIPFSNEDNEIFKRFGSVFEQTYTRFLDLQKAEEQASLDRVRGEIASMRSKDDLKRITPLVWQELTNLGVTFIRCGVFIIDEKNNVIQTHLSTPDGKTLGIFDLPTDSEEITIGAVSHWKKGKIFKDFWDEAKFIRFMQSMIKHGRIDDPELYQGAASPPESLHLNFLPFKQGMLYVGNTDPISDQDLELAKSLADALSIAYARYEDFKHLEEAKNQIQKTLDKLRSTQTQLIHSEKMASLGELTAGIAHEIQNPLNFVNNFSEVSEELIEELKEELKNGDLKEVNAISNNVIENLKKINQHGRRASSIVKGMLEHSRSSKRKKELTDLNVLADEYLRLAYHGLRAKDKSFNADFKTELDLSLPKVKVISQDIGRVLLNLINNAFYAVSKKIKEDIEGYKPMVTVKTKRNDKTVEISVQDNGPGIPKEIQDKIFQPFFTTKPAGQGTGLGLSLSFDIIAKGHDGKLEVETDKNIGTRFTIILPTN